MEERQAWVDEGWSLPDDADNLRAAFSGFAAPVQTLLNEVDKTFLWGLFNHPVLPRWQTGQVGLIGDACHPMLPFLAQGAVMGMEDAYVLATEMAGHGIKAGLARYEKIRKPRATKVQQGAARNAWSYHLRTPVFRSVAHTLLGMVPSQTLLGQFDWLYGHDVTEKP